VCLRTIPWRRRDVELKLCFISITRHIHWTSGLMELTVCLNVFMRQHCADERHPTNSMSSPHTVPSTARISLTYISLNDIRTQCDTENGARSSTAGWATLLRVGRSWGSISDGVSGIFHWHNPSSRTMAVGSIWPLTEISIRDNPWGVKAAGA